MEIAKLVLEYVKTLAWPLVVVGLVWVLRSQIKEALGRLTRVETLAGSAEFAAEARNVLDEAEGLVRSSASGEVRNPPVAVPAPDSEPEPDFEPEPGPEPRRVGLHEPRDELTVSRDEVTRRLLELLNDGNQRSDAVQALLRLARPDEREFLTARCVSHGDAFTDVMAMAPASPVSAVITAWTRLESLCKDLLREHRLDAPSSRMGLSLDLGLGLLGLSEEAVGVFLQLKGLRDQAVQRPETVTISAAQDFVRSCRAVAHEVQRLG
ncbi:hypothetical protein ACFWNT_11780 [Streptomyces sp. NPDC058409]|uniref:hypothetical protein n=1 Tax=Streptomyces sp. NPDC058409 TaxID=3346484 RepID=UPI00364C9B6E